MTSQPPATDQHSEVVTIGETMVMLTPPAQTPLSRATTLSAHLGGAESNVAMYLANLGHRVRWAGAVGADPFGQMVLRELQATGVGTTAAAVDPDARTGVYFKNPENTGTTVHYYRDGSAATRLTPELLLNPSLTGAKVVHLSGITAALSPSCLQLMRRAILDRELASAVISFDINFRPALWSREVAAPVLAELAEASDVVFVGLDEAALLWGCETAAEVRAALRGAGTVVVKNDAHGAESFGSTGRTFTPAPRVRVVEAVGAGDAFAAGYISGLLRDFDEEQRLRLGHLVAAQALSVTSDHAPVPPFDWFLHHLDLSRDAWGRLELDLDRMAAK